MYTLRNRSTVTRVEIVRRDKAARGTATFRATPASKLPFMRCPLTIRSSISADSHQELVNEIKQVAPPEHPDFTCQVFERIKSTPELKQLDDKATTPLPSQSADKRRQYVNQCIGRFCKRLIGWQSDEEVALAKDRGGLIKSYTRLKPPPAWLATEGNFRRLQKGLTRPSKHSKSWTWLSARSHFCGRAVEFPSYQGPLHQTSKIVQWMGDAFLPEEATITRRRRRRQDRQQPRSSRAASC